MKKLICIILLIAVLLPINFSAAGAESPAYGQYANFSAGYIPVGDFSAYHLYMTAEFDAVSVRIFSYGYSGSKAQIALYKWDADYKTSVAGQAVASIDISPVRDGQFHTLSFAAQPAGEYVVCIKSVDGCVAIWYDRNDSVGGYFYHDGVEYEGQLCMTVRFLHPVSEPFEQVDSCVYYSGKAVVPPESSPSADSLLVTRPAGSSSWVATDGLGRTLPGNEDVGDVKKDKIVGMFFWDWHERPRAVTLPHPYNVQKAIENMPEEAKHDYSHPFWNTATWANHWNESIYGYYLSVDEWVIRKQAELLADAGVDVIFFDNTNGTHTWRESYTRIFKIFAQARADGVNTPKISFILPFNQADAEAQIQMLYEDIYKPGKYQDLWFYFEGKPMIMTDRSYIDRHGNYNSREIYNFFTFRNGGADYTDKTDSYGSWGWLSTYPQAARKNADGTGIEFVTVATALNHDYVTNRISPMNGDHVMGRTYTSKGIDTSENAVLKGACFTEQFEYALTLDPQVIFITGWNEYVAGRFESWGGYENSFPDQYNDEFSRDLEPSKGQLKDHYYYLLASYIRKFKGAEAVPEPTSEKTIDIAAAPSQWDTVGPEYVAYPNNIADRDCAGYGNTHYTETSGRNDFVSAKIARDAENLYFYVRTAQDITLSDNLWMNLYIDCAEGSGWNTFDYVLNKTAPGVLERFTGDGYESEIVGTVEYTVQKDVMQVKIPKAALGLEDEYTVNFKWTDNVHDEGNYDVFSGDIMDFYISGDVAPGGRYKFSYRVKDVLYGDADFDGQIRLADVLIAAKCAIGEDMDDAVLDRCDMNRDGAVTLTDVVAIAKRVLVI